MPDNELTERGLFWFAGETIPEGHFAPDATVSGQLSINAEGRIDLSLDGVFDRGHGALGVFKNWMEGGAPPVAICGFLVARGDYVLLLEAYEAGLSINGGVGTEQYFATSCLIGRDHIPFKGVPPKFARLTFSLDGYGRWLGPRSTKIEHLSRSVRFRYQQPKPLKYATRWGSLSINRGLSFEVGQAGQKPDFTASEHGAITNYYRQSLSLRDLLMQVLMIEDLLVLLTNIEQRTEWPKVRIAKRECDYTLYHARWRSLRIQSSRQPWITLADITDQFAAIFTAWVDGRKEYGPGFYLYLATRRGLKLYEAHRFMNLIWGLETLHREKHGDGAPSAALKAKLERIFEAVTSARDRTWLKKRLRNAAEPALDQRLFALFEGLPLGLDKSKLLDFCTLCSSLRNDISHRGGSGHHGEDTARLVQLNNFSEALSLLYHVLIITDIGISSQLVERIATRTHASEFNRYFTACKLR